MNSTKRGRNFSVQGTKIVNQNEAAKTATATVARELRRTLAYFVAAITAAIASAHSLSVG